MRKNKISEAMKLPIFEIYTKFRKFANEFLNDKFNYHHLKTKSLLEIAYEGFNEYDLIFEKSSNIKQFKSSQFDILTEIKNAIKNVFKLFKKIKKTTNCTKIKEELEKFLDENSSLIKNI